MRCSLDGRPQLAAFLGGAPTRWADLRIDEHALLELCRAEDLSALCFHRFSRLSSADGWPASLCDALSETARLQAAKELLHASETRTVLGALARAGVRPMLIKGTALAYTVYEDPASRARHDTDLLVAESDVPAVQRVMVSLGYAATVYCDDLFSQFEVQKVDRFGVCHAFDVHWKISTQTVFQSVLTYGDILSRAEPVPMLGPDAITPGPIEALLLACVHPVMHHRNEQRVLWIYDIHLLASRLSSGQFEEFAALAARKQVAAVCAHQLLLAQAMFQTDVPAPVLALLSKAADEPSAAYLASQRRWHHEVASSMRALPRFGDRVKLMRDVLLPPPSYMLAAYGLRGKPLAPWLLPALYVHRNVRGAWKVLTGKK